ncbi:MAG: cysteine desulfurase family protein [Geminicoccaceae bacterium]
MPSPVYLDCNATAPVKPRVIEAMAETMAEVGNPSSVHAAGRAARKRLSTARAQVAALVGVSPEAVVFTSGGTEANNQALAGMPVMASAIEHPSVMSLADMQACVPVDGDGLIELAGLSDLLASQHAATLAVMMANNETGVIQPVKEVAAIAREAGVRLHVDAIQAAGKIPIDFPGLGADTLSLSAHKFGGPQGVGALICREGVEPAALLQGGSQERRFRAGTENLPGIVGFGLTAALALEDNGFADRVGALRDRLEAEIADLAPNARIIGAGAPRLPNTTCLALPGIGHDTQLIHFDLAGIAVSAGSACSSGKVGASPVLAAMGLPDEVAASAIRISFGWNSDESDVDRFLLAVGELLQRRGQRRSA